MPGIIIRLSPYEGTPKSHYSAATGEGQLQLLDLDQVIVFPVTLPHPTLPFPLCCMESSPGSPPVEEFLPHPPALLSQIQECSPRMLQVFCSTSPYSQGQVGSLPRKSQHASPPRTTSRGTVSPKSSLNYSILLLNSSMIMKQKFGHDKNQFINTLQPQHLTQASLSWFLLAPAALGTYVVVESTFKCNEQSTWGEGRRLRVPQTVSIATPWSGEDRGHHLLILPEFFVSPFSFLPGWLALCSRIPDQS